MSEEILGKPEIEKDEKDSFLFRVRPEIKDILDDMARKRGMSVTAVIVTAIVEYIKQHREDI